MQCVVSVRDKVGIVLEVKRVGFVGSSLCSPMVVNDIGLCHNEGTMAEMAFVLSSHGCSAPIAPIFGYVYGSSNSISALTLHI